MLPNAHYHTNVPMKVFNRPEQVASNQAAYSLSVFKPKLVIDDWIARGIIQPQDIYSFDPAGRADLKRAHNPQMVDAVGALRSDLPGRQRVGL